ncbi:hypothetical protein QE152_g35644 [Popillia japonica]|uniref:Uncharacterized protein n=1 Tax=Popillia japonica TaxID=7064 RepID=A0AAW1IF17_POPJA
MLTTSKEAREAKYVSVPKGIMGSIGQSSMTSNCNKRGLLGGGLSEEGWKLKLGLRNSNKNGFRIRIRQQQIGESNLSKAILKQIFMVLSMGGSGTRGCQKCLPHRKKQGQIRFGP